MIIGQLVILTGCLNSVNDDPIEENPPSIIVKVQKSSNYDYFNTVSYVSSYANDNEEVFNNNCDEVFSILKEYHRLFDIYHEYAGINNLCTLNKNAGKKAIIVDKKLIDFLLYCKDLYALTNGKTNVMMGAVLKLWHDEREAASDNPNSAKLPDMENLKRASLHTSIDLLEIDTEKNTVRISDPDALIDVGAIGKGYATEMSAQFLEEKGCNSYVLDIGGNIRIIGTKIDGTGWLTGIKDPINRGEYSFFTRISDISCVTSGDYERYYTVEGKRYHHIIDNNTLMPSEYFASVTIFTKNSGLADALSTALFCMSYEDGLQLVNNLEEKVDVLWIYRDGTIKRTDGVIEEQLKG